MSRKNFSILFCFLICQTVRVTPALAQTEDYQTWIKVENDRGESAVMNYGNNAAATYGIDKELGEAEGPPLSPALDVRWVNSPGRLQPSYGIGLLYNDFVPCPLNSARKDTFVLLVSDGMGASAMWKFSWPDEEFQKSLCDSMFLVDPVHNGKRVDMVRERSYTVTEPESPVRLRIYKYGGCPCVIAGSIARSSVYYISESDWKKQPQRLSSP
jgi:hypothetical protein